MRERICHPSQSESYIIHNKLDHYLHSLIRENEALKAELCEKSKALKTAASQLAHAEKMATLGIIGAGVAHELNNPLTIISAEADEILEAFNDSSKKPDITVISAKNIKQCAERMRYIVDNIRNYSRKEEDTHWQKISLNEVIKDSVRILKSHLVNSEIKIILSLSDNIPKIWGHLNKLESVFQNLISNAKDAFTELKQKKERQLEFVTERSNGYVIVKVKDNAGGIPKELTNKIFEPFFTTKKIGQGTGLGLAIASDYVKEHGGTITVNSTENAGTEFVLEFPFERRRINK